MAERRRQALNAHFILHFVGAAASVGQLSMKCPIKSPIKSHTKRCTSHRGPTIRVHGRSWEPGAYRNRDSVSALAFAVTKGSR